MYIEIKFHDNDFSYHLMTALEDLWNKLNKIKIKSEYHDFKSTYEVFKLLYDKGSLIRVIKRSWVLACFEDALDYSIVNDTSNLPPDAKLLDNPMNDKYTDYLNPEIEFHKDNKFMNEDQNGEHVSLNLDTGIAMMF